jgi:hypothetical protein
MIELATAVPSAPQTGHATLEGIRPLTGSMSNEYRCPHPQLILIGIISTSWLVQPNAKAAAF